MGWLSSRAPIGLSWPVNKLVCLPFLVATAAALFLSLCWPKAEQLAPGSLRLLIFLSSAGASSCHNSSSYQPVGARMHFRLEI